MKQKDLHDCPICGSLDIEDEEAFLADLKCTSEVYPQNDVIIKQGDLCDALYVLIVGSVKVETLSENGNIIGIEIIHAPRPIASEFLFSNKNYFPLNIITLEETEILKIPRKEITNLMMTNPDFMQNYLVHNANRTQHLTHRLQLLSIKTIKGKIAHYLLEETKDISKPFIINKSQSELAELFGVARPSLARSLSEMVHDNIISITRKEYQILNVSELRSLIQ